MTVLRRIARNVSDLAAASAFYAVLGFSPLGPAEMDGELAAALGVTQLRTQRFAIGAQQLELTQCMPAGAAYPAGAQANDAGFQHIAIITRDIFALHRRALEAGATAISQGGPQQLPEASGGVIAWKFRDPDRHPLELLQWPDASRAAPGYDHSAICVSDAARSLQFYAQLGFSLRHRHRNHGPEQNRLDGLEDATVEVLTLASAPSPPHLELLGYRHMAKQVLVAQPNDIAADRLVLARPGGLELRRDPDGHLLLFEGRK
jgi:catechol 2,3-dioxygenase-like lactoylglutathione lyase family enzyme